MVIMTLTGKCKTDFEEWYLSQDYSKQCQYEYGQRKALNIFNAMMLPFRWGVYADFFDSKRILVSISGLTLSETYIFDIGININVEYWGDNFKTMNDARTAAIEKANEIYNSN